MPDEPAPAEPVLHKTRLNEALQAAEWAAAQGPMSGPILHLRQRGDAARRNAIAILWALIVTVLFGLLFYLGGPYVKQYVDGTRQTLDENIAAANQELATLAAEREAARALLVTALQSAGERLSLPGSESVKFRGALALGPDRALLFGSQGTAYRLGASGAAERLSLPGSERVVFTGALTLGPDRALLYGSDSTIILLASLRSEAAKAPDLSLETVLKAATDPLTGFIDQLPTDLRKQPAIDAVSLTAQGIAAQHKVIVKTLQPLTAKRKRLDDFPYNFLLLEKQREDFASFMEICRHEPAPAAEPTVAADATEPAAVPVAAPVPTELPPPEAPATIAADQMTLACLSGWNDQRQSETESWWQTLAVQVPPGILLLFLLSTLAALYRYNLRLAGFHHSRADALELMAMGKTKDDIEQLTSIAAVLAADKVVFGRDDAATKQAADLLRSLLPTK